MIGLGRTYEACFTLIVQCTPFGDLDRMDVYPPMDFFDIINKFRDTFSMSRIT